MQAWPRILERLRHIPDEAAVSALLRRLHHMADGDGGPRVLAFVNAHALNLAATQPQFAHALLTTDMLLRDGSGLAWLLGRYGQSPGLNMNGTDFVPRLLLACDGLPTAVLGTRDPYLTVGLQQIQRQWMPHSTLWGVDGFQESSAYLELLRQRKPALVLLGMGMPRQEQMAQWLKQHVSHGCLIVCVGALIDFMAGRTRRAPPAWRRAGLEWLWRLAQEPRRLFGRYVIGNPLFVWRSMKMMRSAEGQGLLGRIV